jgi:rRNA-processing protein FCF1
MPLATALLARAHAENLQVATHDGELATAARAVGFDVLGVTAPPRRNPRSP